MNMDTGTTLELVKNVIWALSFIMFVILTGGVILFLSFLDE
jgi:hypothetical protein